MLKCYQLVGVPASGKSTWVENQDWAKDYVIVSTDDFVEKYAADQGKTYNEVFKEFMPIAVKMMATQVADARCVGLDIIWDQTSVSIASRKKKFAMLPDYEHIAVVFKTPEASELHRRLAGRHGKSIPSYVLGSMIANFEMPTLEEGFTEIWYV